MAAPLGDLPGSRNGGLTLVASFAEELQQPIGITLLLGKRGEVLAVFHSPLNPSRKADVAKQDRSDQVTVAQQESKVATVVFGLHFLEACVPGGDLADAEEVQAQNLKRMGSRDPSKLGPDSGHVHRGDTALRLRRRLSMLSAVLTHS